MQENDASGKADLLSAIGWDLRGLGEAQLRDLTAMQRCIDDFRRTSDREAAFGVLRHAGEIETRSPHVQEALGQLRDALAAIDDSYRQTA